MPLVIALVVFACYCLTRGYYSVTGRAFTQKVQRDAEAQIKEEKEFEKYIATTSESTDIRVEVSSILDKRKRYDTLVRMLTNKIRREGGSNELSILSLQDMERERQEFEADVSQNHICFLEMCSRLRDEAGIEPEEESLVEAMLAQHGKISRSIMYGRSVAGLCKDDVTGRPLTQEQGMEHLEAFRKFYMWYDKELEKHGMPYRMLFIPVKPMCRTSNWTWVASNKDVHSVQDNPEELRGVYFWEPMRQYAQTTIVPVSNRYAMRLVH